MKFLKKKVMVVNNEINRKSDKFSSKKSPIFWGFETKGRGEGGSIAVVSKRENMSDFYFASIPNVITADIWQKRR